MLLGIVVLSNTNSFAQTSDREITDSLLAQKGIYKTVRSFYIKPVFEQYQSLITVVGNGFSSPKGDLARKRGIGIRLGYRWKSFELETGLSGIRPAVGFRYLLDGPNAYGHTTRTISTDFYHIPLLFRYRFWQPTRELSLRVGAGVAYNVDLDKLKLAPTSSSEESTVDPDGNRIVLARTRSLYESKKSFVSAEVNLSVQYQFSAHFSTSVEARRLISPTNTVRVTASQETFYPPAVRTVEAIGGANSLGINIGLAYQFGFNNRYRLQPKTDR